MIERIAKLRQKFKGNQLEALFITNQYNVCYLTGFTGLSPNERESFLFITATQASLLTFPTYYGLFKEGGSGFQTLSITGSKRLVDHLNEIIGTEKIKIVGFEKQNLTVGELESLTNKLNAKLRPTEYLVEELRLIKGENEIRQIKKAAQITDLAFTYIKTRIKKGVSEKELALDLEFYLKRKAGNVAFPPIVAFNKNAAIPHYLPENRQHLTDNSLILLDFGAKVNGYCADMTRVVFFGNPNNKQVKIYNTVLKAQELTLKKLRPELLANEVDFVAREYIKSSGFPEYPHGLGHGVGLAIHEAPRLKSESTEVLKENMVVTVEPGIYLEGECGVRIEDLVVLKKDGLEILSKSPKLLKELIIL
ncbi:hypothetical protein A2960_02555 [Candidatus Gottesmanbacteria bacterium RIFCSPLOWO2_01_FULL_39_12b]|uniref:Peptidase M24 n=1 Tax=Candidatus Gottesmanbacteria bacterium RIFCSPLOWO2_01_FULL_39_12b TaxID=1798388 RepID=A0A1F6AR81_9BACT|nr:MAG: hypothetical protein A2960_02555 [Candidatus Gottesmanbacteria bacterium RIFCSPLOWO2_01_FULL_39_12b]